MYDPLAPGETELLVRPSKFQKIPPPNRNWLFAWLAVALFGSFLGAFIIAGLAYDSESAGVTAALFTSGPMGFIWGGTLGALFGYTLLKDKLIPRRAAPLGCGCGCGGFLFFALLLFFNVVWPNL